MLPAVIFRIVNKRQYAVPHNTVTSHHTVTSRHTALHISVHMNREGRNWRNLNQRVALDREEFRERLF